jgi:hypothetical protein
MMISRKTLFTLLLGIVGVIIITSRMAQLPARIVIINQSGGSITRVAIATDSARTEMGSIDNGQTRRLSVSPTATLRLAYEQGKPRVWVSPKGLNAGQSLVLYVAPEGKIEARDRLGEMSR